MLSDKISHEDYIYYIFLTKLHKRIEILIKQASELKKALVYDIKY